MSADQISDVALPLEYVKQYGEAHKELNYKQVYLLEQCVVWQRLSVHLGWQCDNVRASYDEIPKATQDEVFSGAKAFVKENKGRYECGGYIYSGEGQELGQFWTKLNVGNAKLQKTSSNIAVGLLPAMVHWWLFGVWIIGLIVLFSVLVKSYTGVLLGTGGSVLGVYLISFFPKAWKYTPTTLMESASLLIGTKSIEDYGIAVLITILLVVICLIVSITVMNRKQL